MRQDQKKRNIFSDKATIIPRKMLQNPQREWVVRDFIGPEGVSLGMAQSVLEAMARKGYRAAQILSYYYPGSDIVNVY